MNYKDAYGHIIRQLMPIIEGLEKPQPIYTQAETAVRLRRLQVEGEEIRLGQNPYPIHHAPRSGSSMNIK